MPVESEPLGNLRFLVLRMASCHAATRPGPPPAGADTALRASRSTLSRRSRSGLLWDSESSVRGCPCPESRRMLTSAGRMPERSQHPSERRPWMAVANVRRRGMGSPEPRRSIQIPSLALRAFMGRAGVARAPIRLSGLVGAGRMPERSQHRASEGRMPKRASGDRVWAAPGMAVLVAEHLSLPETPPILTATSSWAAGIRRRAAIHV